MYNISTINYWMLYIKVVGVNPKNSHHNNFFYYFNFVSLWEDGRPLNLLWQNHFMMYVNQIIILYTNLYGAGCQLYLNKTERKKGNNYN